MTCGNRTWKSMCMELSRIVFTEHQIIIQFL